MRYKGYSHASKQTPKKRADLAVQIPQLTHKTPTYK